VTPPTVSITGPAAGATVSGSVTVTASAADNVGVAGVQFRLDGATYGAEVTVAPYRITWATTGVADGSHTLTAVARDAAGNAVTSAGVSVTVSNTDATPPTVTITSPVGGATVSGNITVAATASDNVGVAGVQFMLDGAPLGTEDAASPYSATWSTTTASNGPHTLTAVARDAAGNRTTSAAVSVTVSNGSSSGGVIFESNWDTVGTSRSAVTDGGRWPTYDEFNQGTGVQLLSVVTGGPGGHNALRVQQRATLAATVQKENVVGQSQSYYVRFYFRNDDTSSANDHIATVERFNYGNLTFVRKYGGATSYRYLMSLYGCGYTYPIGHWEVRDRLNNGQWYRFEYFVEFVDANHLRVHPRVFDINGTLLYSEADFRQEDYQAGGTWNGRSDWTLASYYAAGFNFCVQPQWVDTFALGNNGATGALDSGLFWYFAAAQIRTDTWPGPVTPVGTTDTTAPTVSVTVPASGATVSGSAVTVSATASDNIGVVGVQLQLDGVNLGAERTTAPYTMSWDTTGVPNGAHTLTAIARDAAGNRRTSAAVTVTVSNAAPPPPAGGIAASYRGDVGIESDPNVIFVERFDETSTSSLFGRWTDILNGPAMSFSTDVPTGSPVTHSLNIPWVGGGVNDGGHLYKEFSPGVDDTLYVRYYVKYPTSGQYQHEGIWMGGYNPPLPYPNPQAGVLPAGNDRFSAAAEQTDDRTHFDHYNYWMNMRRAGDGNYWGNTLLNDPNTRVKTGQWECVEHMVKLNNPVTSFNGEHAIWIDGVKVSHLGQGFPNGTWSGGNFTQTPGGTPFEGFRWRSDANLNLNYIWLQVYAPLDPAGFNGAIKYAHVVAARSYIGCLAP